jgi:cyclophilin family peptidyl-prolyl cis-trans isomerase
MGKGAIAEHAIGPFFCANLENFAYYGCRVSHTQLADRATGNLMHNSWRNWILTIVATIFVAATAGCNNSSTASNASPAPSPVATIAASPTGSGDDLATKFPGAPILKGKATVLMMVKGEAITLELDGDNAPVTAGNFADLISKNVYDGLIFHRVVRQPSPFVAQGGDPKSKDPNVPIEQLGQSGYLDASGQERRIPLEIKPASSAKTIYGMTFEQASLSDKPTSVEPWPWPDRRIPTLPPPSSISPWPMSLSLMATMPSLAMSPKAWMWWTKSSRAIELTRSRLPKGRRT